MDYFDALNRMVQPIRASHLPQTLEPMQRLLAALDHPERAFPSVVVAGSTGKGTTCTQIAALLGHHSKVGRYTSPHLHSFRERFAVNDHLISQQDFTVISETVLQAAAGLATQYSTFELATALALCWFRQQGVEIAVLEIGIGGRYDAVNAVPNVLAVITPIEREHAAMLGGTLTSIAHHKAGIIQPQGYAISAPQNPEVAAVLRQEAVRQQASLATESIDSLAVAACANLMQRTVVPDAVLPAASPVVHLAGRMELVEREGMRWLIDGAHTPTSGQRLRDHVDRLDASGSIHLIVGMLRDKAAVDFLAVFDAARFRILLTQTGSHRALAPQAMQEAAALKHATITLEPDLQAALRQAMRRATGLTVITGSLRTAALAREHLGLLTPEELSEAQRTRTLFEGVDYLSKLG